MVRSLIAAIGIFRMLQGPQRAAARDWRNRRKVIGWGRRTDGPFQCPCVPGIVTGSGSLEIGNDEVCNKHENRDCLNKRADRNDEVQGVPTAPGLVGVDSTGHAQYAGDMHDVERQVEANQEQPEMPFAQTLAQHSASYFGIPVVERGEDCEQDSAYNHVMKVRHYKIGQAKLPIERRGGLQDACQTRNEELE